MKVPESKSYSCDFRGNEMGNNEGLQQIITSHCQFTMCRETIHSDQKDVHVKFPADWSRTEKISPLYYLCPVFHTLSFSGGNNELCKPMLSQWVAHKQTCTRLYPFTCNHHNQACQNGALFTSGCHRVTFRLKSDPLRKLTGDPNRPFE